MFIREYETKDRPVLMRCMELLQDHVASLDPLHRIRTLADFDIEAYMSKSLDEVKSKDGIIYVAEDDGKIVGCIIGIVRKDSPEDENLEGYPSTDGIVEELLVLPEYRGKKIGNTLMEKMERYFISKNCGVVKVNCFSPNIEAHKFYENLGYVDRLATLIKSLKP